MLYYDGEDVRLLTRLYEQHRSCLAEAGRETFGVCKAGDNVMIVGHDLQVIDIQPDTSRDSPQHLQRHHVSVSAVM